ncbi:hypothetical protein F5888DRAFT_451121 [Russula emetica]|nr:hypothetical protein F5888DRAFT_451121 [Russula emetica]
MSLSRPDPHGPSGCTCVRSQGTRQWPGHPYPGPSAMFVNPFATGPSPALHHALHESNEFHDSRNHHSFTNLQHSSFPRTLYNNTNTPNPTSLYYQPSQNVTPSATQSVPSPSNGRKRKNKSGRGGAGRKRQRQPAPIIAAPASAICSVGPPTAVPTDSNLPDNDSPLSSPQTPTIIVQPPVNSLSAPSASTQVSPTLYPSLRANREPRERSAAATDVWYFCRSSDSELRPTDLPSPDQEPTLTRKPCTPFVSCKLCKEWQVYKNTDGITTTMRNHLKRRHSEEYERVVSLLKLKHSNDVDHPMPAASSPDGPFNLDEWIRLMIRWIVTDDQVRRQSFSYIKN